MNLCEITLKKDQTPEGQKRPDLLIRKIEVPELKGHIRLKVTVAGLKVLKDAGGITKFLTERDEAKLLPKLKKLKAKLVAAGKIKVKAPEPTAEEVAAAEKAKAEAAPKEEAAKEEAPKEAAPKEKAPKEAAASEEKPAK